MIQRDLDSLHQKKVEKTSLYMQMGVLDEIHEGDNVSYDVEEGPKGLNAVNVKVV